MASHPPGACCTLGTLHEGTPSGKTITIDGGKTEAYLATPPEGKAIANVGIIYLADVHGIWQNSKLMADAFAENGYLTLIPDIFNGDPRRLNVNEPPLMTWLNEGSDGKNPHTKEFVDPVVVASVKALRDLGVKKIGSVGYCFGAKYTIRNYKNGIDVGYVAHPSFVDEDELAAIGGPLAISAAQTDSIFPAEKRHKSEEILIKTGQPFQINLYSGVAHGFSVRGDPSVKIQKYAKEQAFKQAVAWFGEYLV